LVALPPGLSDFPALKCLLTILKKGGKITKAPNQISNMLNGLKYYALEVTMNEDHYYIQGYEQEAIDLYDTAMTILDGKNTIIRIRDAGEKGFNKYLKRNAMIY
jgi:hypothetical protein